MPSANIYFQDEVHATQMKALLPDLRNFLAKRLSCGDRHLTPQEISLRVIRCDSGLSISSVEIEISAFAYAPRIAQEDEICRDVTSFLENKGIADNHVWLQLMELGHSWKDNDHDHQ